ncbi:MAG: glutathione S-transferase family protein [Pseudomonadota bacterium]
MLKIYHVTGTRGTRAIWLCEELGLDYAVEKVDFSAQYRATPEWRAMNPVGKVPVLQDGDMTMFESGAMMEYILTRYADGQLQPSNDSQEYSAYLQWMWFAEATLARPLGEIVNHGREFPGDQSIPSVVAEMENRAALSLQAVADQMRDRDHLVGAHFTAADIMMGYSIQLAEALIPSRLPKHLSPYWARLKARPAYQRAIEY